MSDKFEREVINMISDSRRYFRISPLVLGGVSGNDGGGGGPPGGFIGHLPQKRVAFDTTEAEVDTIPESGASILDNLNRIRRRISLLEVGSGIVTDFISLTDTPASYTGQSGKSIIVNLDEDGLVFGDASGGVEEAPIDGKQYVRKDADWAEVSIPSGSVQYDLTTQIDGIIDDFTVDSPVSNPSIFYNGQRLYQNQYTTSGTVVSLTFVPNIGDSLVITSDGDVIIAVADSPHDTKTYGRKDGDWVEVTSSGGGGVEEAPVDGKQYARKDADWVEITASGGPLSIWMPDAPPETPGSLDDEFTSTLTGWTTFDPNSRLTATRLATQNMLKLSTPNGHWELSGLYKELSGDFTVWTKISLISPADTYTTNNYISAGIAFWTDPTDPLAYLDAWGINTKGEVQYFGGTFDDLSEYAGIASVKGTTLYLRVRRTGGEMDLGVSTDGIGWLELVGYELIGTVYFGPFVCSQDALVGLEGNTTGLFSYIRYVNSDVGRDGIMSGNLV